MNIIVIVGNLGRDVEVRQTQTGLSVATLSVATTDRVKRDGDWTDETEWHRVVVFDKQADNAAKYLAKGSKVAITGKVKTRQYQDKNGETKYATEIAAHTLEYLSKPPQSGGQAGGQAAQSGGGWGPGPANSQRGRDDHDDYIPF